MKKVLLAFAFACLVPSVLTAQTADIQKAAATITQGD